MNITRRDALIFSGSIVGLGSVHADPTYPSRPVSVVVPYPAGGPADQIGRLLATRLAAKMGQPFVVENRAGASSNMGTEYVSKAAADGYTLLFASSPALAINTSLYSGLKYHPLTSFDPIVHAGSLPNVLLAHGSSAPKSLDELRQMVKNPDFVSYASAGSGGTSHLAGVLFEKLTGGKIIHVPFKGTAPALQALLGGHVTITFTDVLTALPHIQSGRLKALGVTASQPSHVLPDVPTLASQGLPGMDVSVFFGMVAPKGMPAPIMQKLSAALQSVFADAELQGQLKRQGLQLPSSFTPAYLGLVMKAEVDRWKKIVQETGAKAD